MPAERAIGDRRKCLTTILAGGVVVGALPHRWSKPMIDTVLLPAHAQTTECIGEVTVGGPLLGNPSGAPNCQIACEDEAAAQGAELCLVEQYSDASGATQCDCSLNFPD